MTRKHSPLTDGRGPDCPIAIVGIGCHFPGGGHDVESFWRLLVEGRSGVREVPPDRWDRERFYHPDPSVVGTMISKWGGFVENLEQFDARFWGISPREAMRMDPQQRWLLQVAWEAIEDSGTAPQRLRGSNVGVFVGIAGSDYGGLQMPCHEIVDAYTNSGCTFSIASNRISYLFDLQGPSVSVDTACSSALVAVWLACQNIGRGTCGAALAGGVNALIAPHASIGFSKASMLSRSGRCFAFDARANGYVRGEGAGLVYLKPLDQALADRDRIYAVICAAVVNQDGHTSSMTVPGIEGQAALLRQAYQVADMAPGRVAYVEAHGTGTPVGDPIEATALGRVMGEGRPPGQKCLIGSVKTNIGHLEAGSGIAGLIKAALVLHERTVPPSLNFEQPNPNIPFDTLSLAVASRLVPLPQEDGLPPVVAVNSFGFGGTNAHVVLEAAPLPVAAGRHELEPAERPCLLPISARDDAALRGYVKAYGDFLADPALALCDVCYSAGARKEHHDRRLVVLGQSARQMRRRLGTWLHGGIQVKGVVVGRVPATVPPLVFVFTGQGAQWWGMGRQLFAREPVFRRTIQAIDGAFRPLAGWSLVDLLTCGAEKSSLDRTDFVQPAVFALQAALAALWESWGIQAAKVIGHSVGEVAAAYHAGVYRLEDAVKIIFHRSRLQHTTGGRGRMLAVGLSAAEAREVIGPAAERVQVAGINSPHLVTLSGDTAPLEQIAERLQQAGTFHRWLPIAYAFHTHQMEPIRDELLQVLAEVEPRAARLAFVSTVTGSELAGERMDALYWWNNVRQPVLFGPAVGDIVRDKDAMFLEIGPHPALRSSIKECLAEQGRSEAVFHSLRRDTDESLEMLTNLAGLHIHGVPIAWAAVNQSGGDFVRLPGYPWSYEPCWLETKESARSRLAPAEHPLLGVRLTGAQPTWQFSLDPQQLAYLNDHRFWDSMVFPGAAYGEIGLALARRAFPDEPHAVEDLEIQKALFISKTEMPSVQVVLDPAEKTFSVYSSKGDKEQWHLHAQGRLVRAAGDVPQPADLAELRRPLADYWDHDKFYRETAKIGYQFGACFQQVQQLWRVHGEALAEIVVPDTLVQTAAPYHLHPAALDACFQVFLGVRVMPAHVAAEDNFYLPHAIRRIHLYCDKPPARLWAHGRLLFDDGASLVADILVYDDQGRRVADILGFRAERVEQKQSVDDMDRCCYQFHWEPRRLRGRGVEGSCEFPSPAEIVAAARAAAPEIHRRYLLDQYHRQYTPRADALVVQLILDAYRELGWQPRVGDRLTFHDFVQTLGIVAAHHRLTRCQLRTLEARGLLRAAGEDTWEVTQTPPAADVAAELRALAAEFPRFAADLALLERAGPNLAAVLAGETDPMDLLFPAGSVDCLEQFYVAGGEFPAYHDLIRVAVARAIAALPPHRPLRVLEVGGGTGSLTRAVLPALPADRTEYLFTDIGPAFLATAKKQFAEYPFVEYKTFDLEKDPQEQGLQPGGYDLILATDVLHATADLKQALSHLRVCLAEGGLLLFLELVIRQLAGENVIFGLLKGWWKFSDTELRRHSPLLDRKHWLALLAGCGFRDVASLGSSPNERECEHVVFLASAPAAGPVPAGGPASPSAAASTYVVLADKGGVADALIAKLRADGHRVVRVRHEDACQAASENDVTIAPDAEDDLRRLLASAAAASPKLAGVVHCWSLDHPRADGMSAEVLRAAQRTGVLSGLHLLHALPPSALHIWFVARDVYQVEPGDRSAGLASAPLVGLLRVANNEISSCRLVMVDLGSEPAGDAREHLFLEVTAADGELEVAYRDGRRHALRLRRVRPDDLPPRTSRAVRPDGSRVPFRLQTDRVGILEHLALHETTRPAPAPHEVEVRVRAGGINFRDVMKALGMYPGRSVDRLWFGDDFAGTVERVGTNVRHLRPGDEVAGMGPYSFRTYVSVDARMVFKKPQQMSFEQAATLPTVFLTAHYALRHLARLQAGEKILVHAGTGGVGQAAIQIAQHLGLEIFATAGTPQKRRLLAEMGVPHVMSSRTLEFADQVLEIGKVDVYRNSKLGMQRLKDNISYFVIDLAQYLLEKPADAAARFAELAERFAAGDYRPLPYTLFPITQAVEAFRYMAQGKHVGKNVLSFQGDDIPIGPCTEEAHRFRADGSYLISGGAGGFCLEVAKWMARHGARHLVLLSRSGPRDEAACRDIEQLRAAGATVIDARGDVTRLDDVLRVVGQVCDELPPLKGVIHGAMVLDDEFLSGLDEPRFNLALAPKMAGAWNLHTATLGLPLEHFVCLSSVSALAGWPKQANYNAGNCFLDALAHYRHARGLPALTVNWGAILGAGFVERNRKTADYLGRIGAKAFRVDEALRVLARLLLLDPVQVAAARLDWRLLLLLSPVVASSRTFASLARESQESEQGGSLAARLRAANPEARLALIEKFMAVQVSGVFGIADGKLDRDTPLTHLGLDSLMAIELKNRIEQEAGITLPMMEIMHGPSLAQLAKVILKQVDAAGAAPETQPAAEMQASQPAAAEAQQATALLERIDTMPEQEIDALLATVEGGDGAPAADIPANRVTGS